MSNLPTWNLADFYPNYKSKLIKDDIDNLNKNVIGFSKKYKGHLKRLNKVELIASI